MAEDGDMVDIAAETSDSTTTKPTGAARRPATNIYAVHAIRPEEICATDALFTAKEDAEVHARAVSTDPGVLAAAITLFVTNRLGERHPLALYVKGTRQQVPHLSDDRKIAANGYLRHPTLRTPTQRM